MTKLGIHFRHPCPHTHQQNGRAERKHLHIVEMGLSMLAQANLPLKFWWDAFNSAVFIINRLPAPVLNFLSPFQLLFGHIPDYSFLKVFGCSCFPYLRAYNHHKLQFRSAKCVFIGYSMVHKGYKCLSPTGRVYIARTVDFNESEFPYTDLFKSAICQSSNPPPSSTLPILSPSLSYSSDSILHSSPPAQNQPVTSHTDTPSSSHSSASQSNSTSSCPGINLTVDLSPSSPTPPQHQSTTSSHGINLTVDLSSLNQPSISCHPMITRSKNGISKPKSYSTAITHSNPNLEPTSVIQALHDPEWKSAMQAEYNALIANHTWVLVPRSDTMKVINNKWVF